MFVMALASLSGGALSNLASGQNQNVTKRDFLQGAKIGRTRE
jgi:hypothetical protein